MRGRNRPARASARPLRIALFSGNYNYVRDGANQALNRLVAYLERQGVAVRVYSPTSPTPAFAPAGTLVPVPSIRFPGRGEYRIAMGLPRRVRADLDAFAPDLVHLSAPDLLGLAAQRWAKARGLPVVTSLHTRFETYCDYYGLSWLRPTVERHLARFYDRSDYVLVPNQAVATEMARTDDGIRVWGRGVERRLFDPARRSLAFRRAHGIGDDELALLFFGRLVVEKGVDIFVETVRRLENQGVPVRPLVVGEGPARSRFAALPGAVLTGHLAGEALGTAVASADIVLNPSRTEAFGNVVLEAMASGLAIVSADAPSARALVAPGRSGLLVAAQDAAAYAAAVRGLALTPALRRRLGGAARTASAQWSWDAALGSVLAVYREALGLMPALADAA